MMRKVIFKLKKKKTYKLKGLGLSYSLLSLFLGSVSRVYT